MYPANAWSSSTQLLAIALAIHNAFPNVQSEHRVSVVAQQCSASECLADHVVSVRRAIGKLSDISLRANISTSVPKT